MKILYTIFSVWKEKRGETVLRAVASALVLPELIKLRTTFVGTAVGVAHCCCTYPLAGPRLLPLAKVSQGYECPTIVGVGVSVCLTVLAVCIHGLLSSPRVLVGRKWFLVSF